MAELKVWRGGRRFLLPFEPGTRLSDILKGGGMDILQPCGGRGICGKCAVLIEGPAAPPTAAEQKAGVRLACQAVLTGDSEVILPDARPMEQIEMGSGNRLLPVSPMPGQYGAAVDIGTTTVVLSLYDLQTGACLCEHGMLNPQSVVAADVMGRISAALSGEQARLQAQIIGALNALLSQACAGAGIDASRVESLVITGNTTMLYLLTGRNPVSLSRAPFSADCLFDETLCISGRKVYLPRCLHAFVGADITCALISSGLCDSEKTALLSDVGTNGELALWKDGELLITSTAAGPAFEGAGISCGCGSIAGAIDRVWIQNGRLAVHTIADAPAAGVCGSGLIDAVAAGLALGEIDETGAMAGDAMALAPGICLLPADIRAVQLAKAAVAAGVETLLETAGITPDEVDSFLIAGGFGSHLNTESAASIGLFPPALARKAKAVGNASLAGAACLLLDTSLQARAQWIADRARHIPLGGNPSFNQHYMDQMMF